MTPAPKSSFDLYGYSLALVGAALFATKGIFIKLAFAVGVSTEATLALRMLVALPFYVIIFATLLRRDPELKSRLTPRQVIPAMAVGALGYYVSSYFDFAGLAYVSAQYARLVLFTYPFFVLLFGVWFFGDRMNWKLVPPMLVTYLGLIVIFAWNMTAQPDGLVLGTVLVLCSALTFALYQHLAKRQMKILGSALFTCIAMSTAAVLAIGQSAIMDGAETWMSFSPYVWFLGLLLGIFSTVLPSFCINNAIARIGARTTAATGSFGPIITTVLAVVILGEDFTVFHAIGTALVLFGCWRFVHHENKAR